MQPTISVSVLNEQIKNLLETTFIQVAVEGELSRITHHNSGHIYFTLKDDTSALSGVMFRGNASRLRFRLEEGLKVVVHGGITLYKPRGTYQISAVMIEPAGQGALALAFEQLKKRLSEEGLFAAERKKELPSYPRKIALITSATGAALQDMKRVAAHRWPLAQLCVYDAVVQGEQAAASLVCALEAADREGYDVIVIGRGGGSMEDLWAFNDETLGRAIAAARTPVVSAVGHEIDWVISDFVADLRAPTPSAGMQLILPDQHEMMMQLDTIQERLDHYMDGKLALKAQRASHLTERFNQYSVERKLKERHDLTSQMQQAFVQSMQYRLQQSTALIEPLQTRLQQAEKMILAQKQSFLDSIASAMQAQDPKRRDKKGFAQIVKEARPIVLGELKSGDEIQLMDSSTTATAVVKNVLNHS